MSRSCRISTLPSRADSTPFHPTHTRRNVDVALGVADRPFAEKRSGYSSSAPERLRALDGSADRALATGLSKLE